jgi:hypothetical protein
VAVVIALGSGPRNVGLGMSLEQAAFLAQVVAAIALLGSQFFVGLQIRQNTRYQKLAAIDALSTSIACLNVPGMENPALGEALAIASRDWWAATREQRIIAHYFLFSYFKLAENAWYQRRAGVIEAGQWFGWENMARMYYHSQGVHEVWWPRRRNAYSEAFQAYLAASRAPEDFMGMTDLFGEPTALQAPRPARPRRSRLRPQG